MNLPPLSFRSITLWIQELLNLFALGQACWKNKLLENQLNLLFKLAMTKDKIENQAEMSSKWQSKLIKV